LTACRIASSMPTTHIRADGTVVRDISEHFTAQVAFEYDGP